MTQSDETPPVSKRLRDAMERRGLTNRGLARLLAQLDTPAPTKRQIEKERRSVLRWLGGSNPGPPNARRLALALGEPPDAFASPAGRRVAGGELGALADQVAALQARQDRTEDALAEIVEGQRSAGTVLRQLRKHLDELRARPAPRRSVRRTDDAPQ